MSDSNNSFLTANMQVHGFTYEDAVEWLFNVHGVILMGLRLNMPDLIEAERCGVFGLVHGRVHA